MRVVDSARDQFAVEQLEEALSHCVDMDVAAPTHATGQVVATHECLLLVSGELAAMIGIHQHQLFRSSVPKINLECVEHQVRAVVLTEVAAISDCR